MGQYMRISFFLELLMGLFRHFCLFCSIFLIKNKQITATTTTTKSTNHLPVSSHLSLKRSEKPPSSSLLSHCNQCSVQPSTSTTPNQLLSL